MEHMVEQTETNVAVNLRCHDCDWHASIGTRHHTGLTYDERREALATAQLVKWVHQDPSLLSTSDPTERTTWTRVRDYLMKGTP